MPIIDKNGNVLDQDQYVLVSDREVKNIHDIAMIIESHRYRYPSHIRAAIAIIEKYHLEEKELDSLPESVNAEPTTPVTLEESTT